MSYRFETYCGFVVGAAIAGVVSLALAAAGSEEQHEGVLRVTRIEVVDAEGNVRMTLGGGREGTAFGMTIFDHEGWRQLYAGGGNPKVGVIYFSETRRGEGDGALTIGGGPRDTGIYAQTSEHTLTMGTDWGGSRITLGSLDGRGVGLGVFDDDDGGVWLRRDQDKYYYIGKLKRPAEGDKEEDGEGGAP
jgi:hypothetical protein